ncbi:hypothetical protein LIER_33615 [Lithospermum erythrorhizon]|uniref:Uncharacterized protein n=1 Tax=Lithospermum erythrorhizon TaxID=34254 RepID=A0AAV3S1A4_LITER
MDMQEGVLPGLIVKEKSRPATAGGLLPLSSPGSSWRGDLRIMLKQTGGEDRPVQSNSEERLLAAGGDWPLQKEMRAG